MKLRLRPPVRDEEWQVCRMLLPETITDAASREYLLCLGDEEPHLVGALSFRRKEEEARDLRIHVVPGYRRRGVGSQLVASLLQSGPRAVGGIVDSMKEPWAASFCERNGFQRMERQFVVEGNVQEMQAYMHRLRARVQMPSGARLIRLPDAPFEQVARLHAEEVAHSELNPWRALLSQSHEMALSPVVMVDGEVAGFLLIQIEHSLVTVHSRVVAPGWRGGWVLVVALSEALDTSFAAGARTARFSYLDTNRDTQRLAERFGAKTVRVLERVRRAADPTS